MAQGEIYKGVHKAGIGAPLQIHDGGEETDHCPAYRCYCEIPDEGECPSYYTRENLYYSPQIWGDIPASYDYQNRRKHGYT